MPREGVAARIRVSDFGAIVVDGLALDDVTEERIRLLMAQYCNC